MAVFKIDVRADIQSSVKGLKLDLIEIMKQINAEPPKIKIALDEKALEKELAGVGSLINNIRKSIQGNNPSVSTVSINTDPVKKEATEVVSIFDKLESRINAIGGSQVELTRMRNALDLIKPVLEEDGRLAEAFYTATNQVYSGHFFEQLAYSVKAYSDQIFDATQLTQQFDNIIMAQTSAAIPLPVSVDDTQIKQLRTLQAILKKASLEVEDFTKTKNNTSWGMSAARLLSVIEQNASAAQLKVLGLKRSLNSVDDVKGLLIGLATGTQGVSYNDGFGLDSFKTSTVQIREAINSHKEFAQRIEQDNAGLIELRNSLINTFGNLPVDPESGALLVTLEQLRQVSSEAPAALQYIDEIEKRINMTLYENRGVTDTPISQIKVEAEEASNSEERLSNATKELVNTVNSGSGLGQLASTLSQIQLLLDSINKSVGELAGNKAAREVNPEITEMVDNLSVVKQLMTDINGENRKIQKAYSKVVGGLKASPESEANIQDLQTLQEEIGRYNSQLTKLRANKATATEEDIRDMHRVQAGINEIISRIQARIDAEQAAAKATNGESLIKRMTDASTAAHRLLNSNVNSSSGSVAYEKLSTTLGELDKILIACKRDAEKLPEQLGMSASEASAKVNTLLQTVSALQNELTYAGNTGTFSRRNINDTLNSMLTLHNRSGEYSGTAEYKELEAQIRLFGDAIQYCRAQGVSLNDAFKHFGTDGKSAIEAANTAMSALRLKVTETAQGVANTKILDEAAIKSDWKIRGLEEQDINKLYRQVRLMADGSNEFKTIEKQYNALVTEQNIWAASGKSYTAAEVQNITQMRASLKALMEQYISDAKKLKTLEGESLAKSRATQRADWKVGGIETGNISSLYSQVQKLQGDQSALNEIKTKYEQLIRLQTLWEENGRDLTAPEVQSITTLREELKALMEQYIETSKERSRTSTANLEAGWQSQGLTAGNIKSLYGRALNNKDLFDDFDIIQEKYRELIQLQEQWKAGGSNATAPEVEGITRLRTELKKLIEDRFEAATSEKQYAENENKRQAALKRGYALLKQIQHAEESWTKAKNGKSSGEYANLQSYDQRLTQILQDGQVAGADAKELTAKIAQLNAEYSRTSAVIHANGEATKSWGEQIGSLAKKFGTWFNITRVIMSVIRAIRKMISSSVEIGAAFTQLRIVTNATNKEMEEFSNTAIQLSQKLGKSITELIKPIETFSRLGYSLRDASALSEYATVLSNVASVDIDEATTGLTSIVKGYNLDVDDAEHVADVLVEVGQKYAVSASEMMEAYEKSGAALHATNTSLEKSAGLIAAANASVQDASVVGK